MMRYKKVSIKGYKEIGVYPVYLEDETYISIPYKIVGVRGDSVELISENGSGAHWVNDDIVFLVSTVCEEQLKPNECQVHNVHCCGGGNIITEHVEFWVDHERREIIKRNLEYGLEQAGLKLTEHEIKSILNDIVPSIELL